MKRTVPWLLTAVLALGVAGCGGEPEKPSGAEAPHSHTGLPAGDGLESSYVGYAIKDLTVPDKAGVPGKLSFQIETFRKTPLLDYITELTKDMHVYVVSTDLSVFRHVHPTMSEDGTWTGNLTVPTDGTYRVITEFTAKDEGGNGDQLVLGEERTIGKPGKAVAVPAVSTSATEDGITVSVVKKPRTGFERKMELGFSRDGKPASLGTYLGVYAHVSAFNVATGALVHMHPLSAPITVKGESVLDFHINFEVPGDYRMFVQTRVSGIVRTIPITVTVAE